MATREPFVVDEWYHCFNRGVDKRIVFEGPGDYERFLTHIYISNGSKNIRVSTLPSTDLNSILLDESIDRGEPIVEIGAYSLMPNHFHILIKETQEGGIATFMQKTFTGYTMYFNNKNERTGALFAGTFKSRHVSDDRYLKQLVPYILLNPIELFEASWKEGVGDINALEKKLMRYEYSSLPDFAGHARPLGKLVGNSLRSYYDLVPSLEEMLNDARSYYEQYSPQV